MSEKARTGVLAFVIAISLYAAGGGVLFLLSPPGVATGSREVPSAGVTQANPGEGELRPAARATPAVYPYPECAACMDWLRQNAGEPRSLEIIQWDRLIFAKPQADVGGATVRITAKYRGRNDRGGYSVAEHAFFFRDGMMVSNYPG